MQDQNTTRDAFASATIRSRVRVSVATYQRARELGAELGMPPERILSHAIDSGLELAAENIRERRAGAASSEPWKFAGPFSRATWFRRKAAAAETQPAA